MVECLFILIASGGFRVVWFIHSDLCYLSYSVTGITSITPHAAGFLLEYRYKVRPPKRLLNKNRSAKMSGFMFVKYREFISPLITSIMIVL
jgi:hypothetical protein